VGTLAPLNITFAGVGTAGAGTISITPVVSTLALTGDLLLCVIVNKYPPNGPAAPTGGANGTWILLGQASGGAGAAGIDAGTVFVTIYGKVCELADIAATMTISIPSGNSSSSRIYAYRNSQVGLGWDFATAFGSGTVNAAGTAWSADISPFEIIADDLLFCVAAINGNTYSYSAQAITSPTASVPLTAFPTTVRTDAGTAQGDDLGYVVVDFNVFNGGDTAPFVYTMTASGTAGSEPAGCTAVVRVREVGAYATIRPARKSRTLILARKKKKPKTPEQARKSIAEMVEEARRMRG
jgi:hypothetical protein